MHSCDRAFSDVLESKIGYNKWSLFKNIKDEEEWTGPKSSKDLFYVWREFKKSERKEIEENPLNQYSVISKNLNLEEDLNEEALEVTLPVTPKKPKSPQPSTSFISPCPLKKMGTISRLFKNCLFWPRTPEKKTTFSRKRKNLPCLRIFGKMEAIFHLCEERKKTTTKKKYEAKVTR